MTISQREDLNILHCVVSKVLLRHHDLKTTQVYLGKINDSEAIRWMDVLDGKQQLMGVYLAEIILASRVHEDFYTKHDISKKYNSRVLQEEIFS